MSGANPVEAKAGTAAALNPPAPSPEPAAGRLGRYMKLGVVVAGSALVLAGGWYGFTHFSPTPPKVVAQSDSAPDASPPPEAKSDEPIKHTNPAPDNGPDIKIPAVPIVSSGPDKIEVPKPGDSGFAALPPPPVPDGKPAKPNTDVSLIEPPPIPSDPTKDKAADTAPPVLLPAPVPGADKTKAFDPDKATTADPFKAPAGLPETDKPKANGSRTGPAPLPGDMGDSRLDTTPPVIRSGGTGDPMPPAPPLPMPDKKDDGPPPVPKIEVDLPAPPKPDADRKSDLPPLVLPPKPDGDKPDAVKSPAPAPDKKDDIPTLVIPTKPGPAAPTPAAGARKDELPTIPKIDLTAPEAVKPPAVTADPPAPVGPMAVTVAPPAEPRKKDSYDEDWHTPRPGDTFVVICQEYFHDARYAPALEAYNKDRRKAGESFIRVPPPWVLKEQFPNLAPKDDDRHAGPEAKPTGNIKFEPAAPVTPIATSRPAPPPAGTLPARTTPTDEYRVIAKDGEQIREVARKTLGDANAWRKLWDLNPDVDPTQPIPAGTTLRVPR